MEASLGTRHVWAAIEKGTAGKLTRHGRKRLENAKAAADAPIRTPLSGRELEVIAENGDAKLAPQKGGEHEAHHDRCAHLHPVLRVGAGAWCFCRQLRPA